MIKLRKAYDFQESILEWGKERDKIPLLVQMRLGKSLIAIRWALEKNTNLSERRILTVCPKSVLPVWKRELNLEGIEPIIVNTTHIKDEVVAQMLFFQNGWYLTNYESITHTNFSQFHFDTVILDESTKIRRDGTKISKKVCEDFTHVKYKAILTGSPAPEGLLDYFNQFKFLFGEVYNCQKYRSFRTQYFYQLNGRYRPHNWFKKEFSDYLADCAYILTRKQVKMGNCKKVYEQRYCTLDKEVLQEYKDFELSWINTDFEAIWALAAFQRLHQMAGGYPPTAEHFRSNHKLDEIQDLIESGDLSDESGELESLVIWCKYITEIKAVKNKLDSLHISNVTFSGVDDPNERIRKIDLFNNGNVKVFIGQVSTGSMGIDLAKADTAIYYSNSLSCLDRLQSEDRIISPAKQVPVLYIDLITKDTIDEDVYTLLESKKIDTKAFIFQVYRNMQARYALDTEYQKPTEFQHAESITNAEEFI